MTTHIQLIPTVQVHNGAHADTRTATPDEVKRGACLWSVYIGEPGRFSWLADFGEHIDARTFALNRCEYLNAQLLEGGTA